MVDPKKVLNVRSSKEYQVNVSVKAEYVQPVADAIDYLLRLDPYKSKSELVCEAVIAYAQAKGLMSAPDGDDHGT